MSHSSEVKSLDEEIRDMVQRMASTDFWGSDSIVLSEEVNEKLSKLHCPFTWKPFNDASIRDLMSTIEYKVSRDRDEFKAWTPFVLTLILCYEYAQKGAVDIAFEKLEECQKIIDHEIASDFSVPITGIGLKHVVNATKIFLLIKSNQIEDATEALGEITEIQEMKDRDQACIWSVRGAVLLEYGLKGMKESIPFLERALQLDSECGEWHFLLGKALARVRRIQDHKAIPDKREIQLLEYAAKASKNTLYMVTLAQSYINTSRQIHFKQGYGGESKSLCNDLNGKAFEMFRKAYEYCKEDPNVFGRCALGFMKLPYPWRNVELARKCVVKGLEKDSNNGFLNYAAAVFYQKENEMDKAKIYYARSIENGNLTACIELLSMKVKENKSYDPIAEFERYLDIFKEKPLEERLWAFVGSYYYFVKEDFNVALNYWSKIVHRNIHSDELENFFVPWPKPHSFNIGKTIITEIIMRLDEDCNEEERKTYEENLATFKKHDLPLVKSVQKEYSERSQYSASQQNTPHTTQKWRNMNRN